jgi:hypothetical protein
MLIAARPAPVAGPKIVFRNPEVNDPSAKNTSQRSRQTSGRLVSQVSASVQAIEASLQLHHPGIDYMRAAFSEKIQCPPIYRLTCVASKRKQFTLCGR